MFFAQDMRERVALPAAEWLDINSQEGTGSVFSRFGTLSTGVCDFIPAVCTVSDTDIL